MRTHTCGELRKEDADKKITLCGWVSHHRVQGKVGFIMLRDKYGTTQIFVNPALTKHVGEIRRESVIQVKGLVKKRPENQIRRELSTGEIEVSAEDITILSPAEPLPLEIDEHIESHEETRLKYRYLDLRRPNMQKNLLLRHKAIQFIRDYLDNKQFVEVNTPILTKSSPEGARDYLVPSRLHKGS